MSVADPTACLPGTALHADQVLPDVTLSDADSGAPWRPSLLRMRSAFVLAFVHADCGDCDQLLADLAERQDDLRWAETKVRAVAPAEVDAPFPVALDPDGTAHARWLGPDGVVPTVLVVDRYAALHAAYPLPGHRGEDVDEVLATVCHLAIQCAECSI